MPKDRIASVWNHRESEEILTVTNSIDGKKHVAVFSIWIKGLHLIDLRAGLSTATTHQPHQKTVYLSHLSTQGLLHTVMTGMMPLVR